MAIGMFMPMLMRRPPLEVSFLQFQKSTVDTTSYSFPNVSFGEPASSRRILLAIHSNFEGRALNSVTIAGIAATVHLNSAPNSPAGVAWASAIIPSGQSGTVVVNLNSTGVRCAIAAYLILNEQSNAPYAVNSSATTAGNVSVDCPSGGAVFFAQNSQSTSSRNPTTITKNYDENVENPNFWVVGGISTFNASGVVNVTCAATALVTTTAISWG